MITVSIPVTNIEIIVTDVNAISVNITTGNISISSAQDAVISSPVENDFLIYVSGYWRNKTYTEAKALMGFGTLASQDADGVAITGGTADGVAITGGTADGVAITGGTADGVAITGGTADGVAITGGTADAIEMVSYIESVTTDTNSGTTQTIDVSSASVFGVTLTGDCVFTFSGAVTNKAASFTLFLTQDGTGTRLATWPDSVKWAGGSAPTLSTAIASIDVLVFTTPDGGTTWYGMLAGADFS